MKIKPIYLLLLSFVFLGLVGAVKTEAFFAYSLSYGDSGSDVTELQKLLNSDNDTKVADSGPGSSGQETSYFGDLTFDAVIRFQEKYAEQILDPLGLFSGTGYVGSATKSVLNSLLGGNTSGSSSGTSGTSGTENNQIDLSNLKNLFSGWVSSGDMTLEDFESFDEIIFSSNLSTTTNTSNFTSTSTSNSTTDTSNPFTSTSIPSSGSGSTDFGGHVIEAGECDVDPNPYVELMMAYFSIIPCGENSPQVPGYLFGIGIPGNAVLGKASPAGFVCVDGQGSGAPLGMVYDMVTGTGCF